MSGADLPDPMAADGAAPAMRMASLAASVRALVDAPDAAALAAILERITVPTFGDVCSVYVPDGAGVFRPLPPRGSRAPALQALYDHEAQAEQTTDGYASVAHDGRLLILSNLSDDSITKLAADPQHRALLAAVGLRSLLLVPLVARGTCVGLLVVGSTSTPRQYDADEQALVGLLASVAASTLAAHDSQDEIILAARELAHLLNNDLTLPVGAMEILLDRADQPPETRTLLEAAALDLAAIGQHIQAFHQRLRSRR
jgi:GAF domain-containing protein